MPYADIVNELRVRFDVVYNENHLSTILAQTLPKLIATAAKKARILAETPV